MKMWLKMSKEEKKNSYKYSGTGFAIGFLVTLVGIQSIGAGIVNGIILGFIFQLFYQIKL